MLNVNLPAKCSQVAGFCGFATIDENLQIALHYMYSKITNTIPLHGVGGITSLRQTSQVIHFFGIHDLLFAGIS